jgi:aspartate/glutamate racemase
VRTAAGLLHTVPALADTFHRRLASSGLALTHVVDPGLLARAIETGVDDLVRERVLAHVRHLAATGADAVMVTCSSIAEAAEAAAAAVDVPVLRVDRAMAERAVEIAGAGRVAVLATLPTTLGPTERLLRRLAAGTGTVVDSTLVEGAVAARDAGDPDEHDRLVRSAVDRAAAGADVVVLAQASMAAALDHRAAPPVPVLESVSTGSERLEVIVSAQFHGNC